MICDTEEFLLLVQKWATDSAIVVLTLMDELAGSSATLTVRLVGSILEVDTSLLTLTFITGEDGVIYLDLKGWEIAYSDDLEFTDRTAYESFALKKSPLAMSLWREAGD